jgi:hypothetical protein
LVTESPGTVKVKGVFETRLLWNFFRSALYSSAVLAKEAPVEEVGAVEETELGEISFSLEDGDAWHPEISKRLVRKRIFLFFILQFLLMGLH